MDNGHVAWRVLLSMHMKSISKISENLTSTISLDGNELVFNAREPGFEDQ